MADADVRIRFYPTSDGYDKLDIRFNNDKEKCFKTGYITLMAKGHRLYLGDAEAGKGWKLAGRGDKVVQIGGTYAPAFRKFEGEYDLMDDGGGIYYVDLDQVRPLTTGCNENKHPVPKDMKRNSNDRVTSKVKPQEVVQEAKVMEKKELNPIEVNVLEILKNKALELLLDGRTEDAEVMAKAVRIMEG